MKKLISIVLTAVLCGTMMTTTSLANCSAEKQPSDERPSSSSSEQENKEENKKGVDYPTNPADAQNPQGELT